MSTRTLRSKKKPTRNGASRVREIVINGSVRIPRWVADLGSFRRWACSGAFPERGRFAWLGNRLHVEVYSELLNHLCDADVEKMRVTAFKPIRSAAAEVGDILIDEIIRVPRSVGNIDAFRRWVTSSDCPAHGQFAFLAGKLCVDLNMETDFHNQIKTIITIMVGSIVLNEALGRFYGDNMLLTNRAIGLSQEPDAMFVSHARFEKGLAVLKEGSRSTELSGSPDMALEVVSKSSVEKDTIDLMALYAKAGVAEYWLVDSTVDTPELVILRLAGGKYVAARKRDGWVKSKVFGRSFRLTCKKDAKGVSQFDLDTK